MTVTADSHKNMYSRGSEVGFFHVQKCIENFLGQKKFEKISIVKKLLKEKIPKKRLQVPQIQ